MSGIICIGNYVKDLESSKKAIENTQKYLDFDSPLQDKHCLLSNYHLKENDVKLPLLANYTMLQRLKKS